MMSHPTPSIDEIFFAAMERESPESQAAYLDEVCGSDQELRRRVERLLDARPKVGSFLDAPAVGPTVDLTVPQAMEGPGTVIGPYKLLEQIGEGGMGVVYMAEQSQPVRRKVALKIIKPGMDTRQVIARFEAERQALAIMDHPHIAQVYDAGATSPPSEGGGWGGGRPYFVMELVRGLPINEYCDQHRLTIPERLGLFMQVCQAVQHAHQKGIIHRDIKPTNVLVASPDGVPWPKVIDFGIAKATGQSLTDKTLFTGFAQLIGTPLYMSPEQAELSAVDVDTRSDVYSLGVLLYELLTGTTPFDRATFRTAALDEVRRIIREDEPPKPSTRLSTLGATLTTVSGNRHTDARKLDRSLRGELDWIVMKALEKDRRRRYETAIGLARDVERHLAGDPVEAAPPSGWYRLRKFARRNRVNLTATALVAVALIAGTTVSIWQAYLARRARADAIAQRDRAKTHLRQAREAVDQMLTEVGQETLSRVPHMEPVRRALLEKALRFYEQFLVQEGDDPAIRLEAGRAYRRVGSIRKSLHQHDLADEAYRHSLDLLDRLVTARPFDLDCWRELAESRLELGGLLSRRGKTEEAEREYRQAIALRRDILQGSSGNPDDRFAWAEAEGTLGSLLHLSGRHSEARAILRSVCDRFDRLVADFPGEPRYQSQFGAHLNDLAIVGINQRDFAGARTLLEQAVAHQQAALTADPQKTQYRVYARNHQENLAVALIGLGKRREAVDILRKNTVIGQSLVSDFPLIPHHRQALAGTFDNLSTLMREMGPDDREAATNMSDQATKLFQSLAAEYPGVPSYRQDLANHLSNRGNLFRETRRWRDAEQSYRQALELDERLLAAEPTSAAYVQGLAEHKGNLAQLLAFYPETPVYDLSQATGLARESIKLVPDRASLWNVLGVARYRAGRYDEAETALKKSMELGAGGDASDSFFLAMTHWKQGDEGQAHAWYDQAVAWMEKNKPKDEDLLLFRAEAMALLGTTGQAKPAGQKDEDPRPPSKP